MAEPFVRCADRAEWRRWLAAHASSTPSVRLAFELKASGRPTVSYDEAVEEALCFGWIDGRKRSLGADGYEFRFTPRRPASEWSPLNVRRAKALIAAERMTPAGLAAFRGHEARKSAPLPSELPAAVLRRFKTDAKAWARFAATPPGYRRLCIGWVASAKRDETREKRLAALIAASRAGRRVDFMKAGAGK